MAEGRPAVCGAQIGAIVGTQPFAVFRCELARGHGREIQHEMRLRGVGLHVPLDTLVTVRW